MLQSRKITCQIQPNATVLVHRILVKELYWVIKFTLMKMLTFLSQFLKVFYEGTVRLDTRGLCSFCLFYEAAHL